uniref:Uncharacterized protein n=1 Tax=Entomoneis paludosa TaxID=265537 RepID=A0A7S3DR65_9STRA
MPRAQPRAQQLSLEHGTGTDLNQLLSSLQSPESTSFTGSTIQQMLLQSRPQSQNRDHLTDLAHLVTSLKSQEAASLADIVPAAQSLQQSFLMPNGLQQQLQGQLTTPLNAIQQQLQGQLSSPFERIQQQQRLQSQLNSSSATPIRQPSSESAVQAQLLSQLTAARAPPQPQLSETTAALMLEALIRNSGTSNSSAPSQLQPQQQTHANSLSSLTAAAATGTSTAAAPQANAPRNSDLQMLLAWHNAQT